MTDVVIAGAGVAGSSLAIQLGRLGFSVKVFERSYFPKEKPCGEGLMPGGLAVLDRLGLRDAIGGQPFQGVRYHLGGRTIQGMFPGHQIGVGQRRKYLDNVLFQTASATPGVCVATGASVDGPLVEGGRVTGLIVDGEVHRAKLTVGADGVHSKIRHKLGLDVPAGRKRIGARCHFRLASGVDMPDWVDIFLRTGYELYVTPLPHRELLVAALFEHPAAPIAESFPNWIQTEPQLRKMLDGACQISDLECIAPLAGRAKRGGPPGVVLLGDAAGFLDPITGGGMTQALMTSELLSRCFLGGRLQEFDQRRQAMLRSYQILTSMVLWLAGHPDVTSRVLGLLHSWPTLFSQLMGVSAGMKVQPE